MRLQLTAGEVRWLADLAYKAKVEAIRCNKETPHPLLELRRDNMADLENKLNAALRREKDRGDAR